MFQPAFTAVKYSAAKQAMLNQIKVEARHAKQNSTQMAKMFLHAFEPDFKDAATMLELSIRTKKKEDYEYTTQGGEHKIREDLIEIHEALLNVDIKELMYRIHAVACQNHEITLQQAVGSIVGAFDKIEMMTRRLQAANLILEYCPHLTVKITKGAEYGYVSSDIKLDKEEADILSQHSVALPSLLPLRKVRTNSEIGYRTFKKSVIMGGKHHDKDVCLSHINKRNAIPFKLNPHIAGAILDGRLGQFDPTPKFNKRTGRVENEAEVQERKEAYLDRQKHFKSKLQVLGTSTFWFSHRRDNRGRTYVEGYHFTYQGTDDQKALINLAHEEFVQPEF